MSPVPCLAVGERGSDKSLTHCLITPVQTVLGKCLTWLSLGLGCLPMVQAHMACKHLYKVSPRPIKGNEVSHKQCDLGKAFRVL